MSSTRQTVREWHWVDEPEPRPIPESWSNQGIEPCEDGEEHWYAVAFKAGTQIEVSVDQQSGEAVDGPHREDRRIAVVYVRGDARQATVRDYRAERAGGGWRPTASEYLSVRAFEGDVGGPVSPENERDYLRILKRYYGVDPRAVLNPRGGSA